MSEEHQIIIKKYLHVKSALILLFAENQDRWGPYNKKWKGVGLKYFPVNFSKFLGRLLCTVEHLRTTVSVSLRRFDSNKTKGLISKRVLLENKELQIFRKTTISYPLIRTPKGKKLLSLLFFFSENLACFVFL